MEEDQDDFDEFDEEEVKIDPATLAPDLFEACKNKETDAARALLDQDVPPFHSESGSEWTCLHWASRHGMVEIVERLLAVKAAQPYAHARARASRTSRSTRQQQGEEDGAAEEGGVEKGGHTSEAVEARYLGISSQVLMRNTPLHWAAFHGHLRVAWLLLEAGYASDDCDEVGNTPLHLAAAGGHAPVVRALLADGCDVQACNHFSNAASAVATDERVRELLRNQAARQLRPPTLAERCASRAGNLRRYRAIATELQQATEGQGAHDVKSLLEQAARLREALAVSREECVAHPLVATGERALLRVVTHIALREQVDAVRREAPIVSQTKYTAAVNKLKRLRREAEELRRVEEAAQALAAPKASEDEAAPEKPASRDDGSDCGASEALLTEADALVARSHAEYWLHQSCAPLDALPCADPSCSRPMARLERAIGESDVVRADKALLARARDLLSRFTAELELRRSMDAVPAVRLPIPEPPADYWGAEDLGAIEETEGFPSPPESGEGYVWHSSATLDSLRNASLRLEKALLKAEHCKAFPDLVEQGQRKHKTVSDELKQLERKDEEDKEEAVMATEKAAKKLKKGKSKKKK